MKKNRMAILVLLASLALTACNNPLLAQNAESASELAAEIEAQVQAALEAAEASGELEFVAEGEVAEEAAPTEEEEPEVEVEATVEPTAEPPPVIESCTDRAEFIADVTVPDGSDFVPGQAFVKTWRLRNNGSCTWTSSYDLVFDHGDAMGGPASQPLSALVHPGEMVDLSVNLTAPGAEGGYLGYWMLRNNEGALFGIGANANVAFWVEIEVLEEEAEAPLIFELAPIPLFPLVVSSGEGQSIPDGSCFDLDAGSVVACGSAAADFYYYANLEFEGFMWKGVFEVRPRHGAQFSFRGDDTPTGAECQAAGTSAMAFDADLNVYCYKTDAGKYGYLKILGRDFHQMSFDWTTYTFP